ncbi:MAG: fibronectin type III domain-containing protein [candidate division WOR-3 bacterium]|nr:fibronectin type III domain-containing protein [candidate division WOR-3 bacterium]MDH5684684.1 fibronectin type III domain-containing protein [candidate division WOR-3 bacterium]
MITSILIVFTQLEIFRKISWKKNRFMKTTFLLIFLTGLSFAISPPTDVRAWDSPNDAGGSINIAWRISPDDPMLDGYEISRLAEGAADYEPIGFIGKTRNSYTDEETRDGVKYQYRVAAVKDTIMVYSEPSNYVQSSSQWFNTDRINVLVFATLFIFLILWFTSRAKKGMSLFIRKIAGLDAVEEAVGRATEMGRPILYIPGLSTMADVATIAGLNILGEVAKKTAQYDTKIIVPNRDPIVYTVAREVVKESYTQVGRPDAFNPDSVFFVTDSQFAFAAAVDGIMTREKPATNFFMGYFWAESLIIAETGASTGAIQIAGSDAVMQLPFFITACDYTLIGEELYAASAYLSREPLLLGALKGQDYGKAVIIGVLLAATLLALIANLPVLRLF